jgi:hypothetical protein
MGGSSGRRFGRIGSVAAFVAACSAPTPTATPSPGPPVVATASNDTLRLIFTMPKANWRAGEVLEGSATLIPLDQGEVALNGSGSGLIGFEFVEVGGKGRRADWIHTADCVLRWYRTSAATPIVQPILETVAGSVDFWGAGWTTSPDDWKHPRLPAGTWDVHAVALYGLGDECGGSRPNLDAVIRIVVA